MGFENLKRHLWVFKKTSLGVQKNKYLKSLLWGFETVEHLKTFNVRFQEKIKLQCRGAGM